MPIIKLPPDPEERRASQGHGGSRAGGGRPKGTTVASGGCKMYKPTAERAELLSLWRAEVSKQFETLVLFHPNGHPVTVGQNGRHD